MVERAPSGASQPKQGDQMAIAQPWQDSGHGDDEHFIELELEVRVLAIIDSQPQREWLISEILDEAGMAYSPRMALLFLQLFRAGFIERLGPARYRRAAGATSAVAKRNRRTFDRGLGPVE